MGHLILKKGGKLAIEEWDGEKQGYVKRGITKSAIAHIWDVCTLQKDVTLKDVFLLMQRDVAIYDIVLGNWCRELTEEALSGKIAQTEEKGGACIEFVELYWHLEEDQGELTGMHRADFHGWGPWSDEAGTTGGIGIEFTPVYELIDYPLKLRETIEVWDRSDYKATQPKKTYKKASYTLAEILYGIVWELSFCGSPKDRDAKHADLDAQMRAIEDGTAKITTYNDADEFFAALDAEDE